MEPRPHERGKTFRKAALKAAFIASMEPRPHERGKLAALRRRRAGLLASMEPRPHERGKLLEGQRRRPGSRRFNGATSSRTWKDLSLMLNDIKITGFNGATSSRTWKADSPLPRMSSRPMLQWSHVLTNVESRTGHRRSLWIKDRFNGATSSRTWKV